MKYEKPVFIVESYTFSDSIAACDIDVDIAKPIKIGSNTSLCDVGDNGHHFGKKVASLVKIQAWNQQLYLTMVPKVLLIILTGMVIQISYMDQKEMETMILMVVLHKHFLEIVQMKIIMLQVTTEKHFCHKKAQAFFIYRRLYVQNRKNHCRCQIISREH